MRPIGCTYPKCSECIFTDCKHDGLEYRDTVEQDKFDKELEAVEPEVMKRRLRQKKYSQSEKAKARTKRYLETEKGKESQRRYDQSDKGKARWKRYYEKKMEMINC